MHILRRETRIATTCSPTQSHIEGLLAILSGRSENIVRRRIGRFDEYEREDICKEVVDRLVDAICDDSDLADYAEVNFNHWLQRKRIDACRKQERRRRRADRLGESVEDLAEDEVQIVPGPVEDGASPESTPETACAASEARGKAGLPPLIEDANLSPEDRYRIAKTIARANLPPEIRDAFLLRHYFDMQIESTTDPDKHTLVKHFGKSEKTIRLWLKRAENLFAELQEMDDERESDQGLRPGGGPARVPR